MNHIVESIRRKGIISNTDTQHFESSHKSIKEEYRLGNKKPGYEGHIINFLTIKMALNERLRLLDLKKDPIATLRRKSAVENTGVSSVGRLRKEG